MCCIGWTWFFTETCETKLNIFTFYLLLMVLYSVCYKRMESCNTIAVRIVLWMWFCVLWYVCCSTHCLTPEDIPFYLYCDMTVTNFPPFVIRTCDTGSHTSNMHSPQSVYISSFVCWSLLLCWWYETVTVNCWNKW